MPDDLREGEKLRRFDAWKVLLDLTMNHFVVYILIFPFKSCQFDTIVDMPATAKKLNTGYEDELSKWFQNLHESCGGSIQCLRRYIDESPRNTLLYESKFLLGAFA